MNIIPISNDNSQSFKGKLNMLGHWPTTKSIEIFENNPSVKKALENYEITAAMKSRTFLDAPLESKYKLFISAKKDNATFMDKIKYFFGIKPKTELSKYYHDLWHTEEIIEKRTDMAIRKILNLEA